MLAVMDKNGDVHLYHFGQNKEDKKEEDNDSSLIWI
jgi:hypothetical protein